MPGRDIVVIGASAGGVEAVTTLVSRLPADLPAAIFVVVHVWPYATSQLPAILERRGALRAAHARHGEAIVYGRIYVAPPNQHLLVREGVVELSTGPRENRTRPAIDPLFRSAARAYGPRVVGIVLTGGLDDGSTGLMVIKARGGLAVVQDPREAPFSSMPSRAIDAADVDHVLPVTEISRLLDRVTREEIKQKGYVPMPSELDQAQMMITRDIAAQAADERDGQPSVYVCPDCGGIMWQFGGGARVQFHCHVGHVWSPDALLVHRTEELEFALWSCVRQLQEKATLTRQIAARTRAEGREDLAARIEEQAALDERHMQLIRETLLEAAPSPPLQPYEFEESLDAAARREVAERSDERETHMSDRQMRRAEGSDAGS